ncbi:Lantibiotic dehydratase, C terminus [Micromonospora echinofusca]|uniref:Lantibiotic dehydratase, C terminus n=1 Tax=Micromonospora echinofusca TaxID=47858 RepID=A0A1C5GIA5_MICEH|nr:lantibiotic dehydratase [Micromonospora echinofusca]SCG18826.1 Lantibiotic dehydratase, C terminus [Micromonospora echinofusca]
MNEPVVLTSDWALWPVAPVRAAGMPFDWLAGFAEDGLAAVRELLAEPDFLAALTWQNPAAAEWARRPGSALTSYRAGVLTRYAQRYCAKNDSIGFFGPVGWATFSGAAGDSLRVTGTAGVRSTSASFELWAVRALAQRWAEDPAIRPHLPVRRVPSVSVHEGRAHRPFQAPLTLEPTQLALLDRLAKAGFTEAELSADERLALARLVADRIVVAEFVLPPGAHPEQELLAHLVKLPETEARDQAVADLTGLIDQLAAAERFVRQPAQLAPVLTAVEQRFAELAGQAAQRTKDEAAAGRTLAYVDCRRDLDAVVPAGLVDQVAEPLGLLLQSARWLTGEVRAAVDERLCEAYAELRNRRETVLLSDLHIAAADVLAGAPGTLIDEIAEDFRLRWSEILRDATGTDPVQLASEDIEALVDRLFPPCEPGWAAARQHSPDLMLATGGGRPLWVLGELHTAMNTLESRFFHTLADEPGQLVELTARDMAGGRIVPSYPYGPQIDSRRYPPLTVHVPDRYLYWAHSTDMGAPDGVSVLPAAGLVVRDRDEGLTAGPRDGRWELPVAEFFGEFLSAITVNRFRIPGPGPRITLDDLVIRRATWAFAADDLPPKVLGARGYRPEVLSAFLTERGLPRHLFAQLPGEPKPFYVDRDAPLLVTNLARSWRRADRGPVVLQEMLPGPDQLWLRDAAGRRYTSEFRMVAVDRRARVLPGLADAGRTENPC